MVLKAVEPISQQVADQYYDDFSSRFVMLFYNDDKHFYLVVEVKVRKFEPADVGQVNAYVAAVNHQLRKSGDRPTIGLIICKEKDRVTAKYSLEGVATPIGIADYALEKFLPTDFVSDLPEIESTEEDQTRRLRFSYSQKGSDQF